MESANDKTMEIAPADSMEVESGTAMSDIVKKDFSPCLRRMAEIFSLQSSSLPQAILASSVYETGKMYRPIGVEELERNGDGTFSATLRVENGKIKKHVPLEKGNSLEAAAKMGWAVTSLIVGQSHMMNIADELAKITERLDELKQVAYDKGISDVEASIRSLTSIDFASVDARKMMHDDCRDLDSGCSMLHKAICREIESMPEINAMKKTEGWFGGRIVHRPEDARRRFLIILRLLPVYLRGMFVLTAMNMFRSDFGEEAIEYLNTQIKDMVDECRLREKVKMVPMIEGIEQSPDTLVAELFSAVNEGIRAFDDCDIKGSRTFRLPVLAR